MILVEKRSNQWNRQYFQRNRKTTRKWFRLCGDGGNRTRVK